MARLELTRIQQEAAGQPHAVAELPPTDLDLVIVVEVIWQRLEPVQEK